MKIQEHITRKEWDVILDTINDLPTAKPVIDIVELLENSLAKYYLPSLRKK